MRNRKSRRITRRGAFVAMSLACAMLLPFFAPAATAAEVVLKQEELTARQARLTHGEDLYNELCAVCHGVSGVGDGPAVPALNQPPLDLTHLAVNNDGVFPREHLEESIYGRSRIKAHGTLDMPVWGRAFEFTKPDWSRMRRVKFAKHRINKIVDYIETLQAE